MIGSGTMATGSACLLSLITLPTRAANVESGAMMMSAATSPRVQAIPGRLTFMATATYGKSASTPRSWLATGAPRLCRAPLARLFATYPTASLPAPGPGKSRFFQTITSDVPCPRERFSCATSSLFFASTN